MTSNRMVIEVIGQLMRRLDVLETEQGSVDKQVKRLAKELYKANLLMETTTTENQETLQILQQDCQQREQQAARQARLEVMRAFLPVVDAIEAGLKSGASQLKHVHDASPEAAKMLYGWLNGQRLLRERLLKLLETEGIYPMDAVGQPFNPYRHVAVKVLSVLAKPPEIVLKIESPGYIQGDTILRFAEVVVNKPQG